jgi:hypothetical protein
MRLPRYSVYPGLAYHGDQYFCVFDLADEAPVAYVIFPELAQLASPQRLPDASGVAQGGKAFAQEAAQSHGGSTSRRQSVHKVHPTALATTNK